MLANPLRLEMLDLLSKRSPLCVKDVAASLNVADEVAGKHLQRLAAAGFVTQKNAGRYLYQTPSDRDGLVTVILGHDIAREQVIYTVTALTHVRRISILRALATEPSGLSLLCRKTGISMRALKRHLEKLERRGFVSAVHGKRMLSTPESVLGRRLIRLALKEGTPAQVCRTQDRSHL